MLTQWLDLFACERAASRSRVTLPAGKTIAVLIDHIDHLNGGYEAQLLAGFESLCGERGVNLLVFVGRGVDSLPHSEVYELVGPECADGVILLTAGLATPSGMNGVERLVGRFGELPFCSLGFALPGKPSVVADNRPGFREAIEHLILAHGKRRIAFIGGPESNPDARVRLEVYREVLQQHGLTEDPRLIVYGSFSPISGGRAAQELLSRGRPFDCVVVANDGMAIAAIELLRERGLRIPKDVAVTGFDDLALCRFTRPPLTTVRQPMERMAAIAVELVCAQMDGHSVPVCTNVPVEFVRRSSCGCDSGLSEAPRPRVASGTAHPLRWLNENSRRLAAALQVALNLPRQKHERVELLLAALRAELEGQHGAFVSALEDLMTFASDHGRLYDELQRALATLRQEFAAVGDGLGELWFAAQRVVALASTSEQVRQRLEIERSYWSLLRSGEKLSTAFDVTSLRTTLSEELPRLVRSAFISLYVGGLTTLRPFFCLRDGAALDSAASSFAAGRLFPPDLQRDEQRRTWFVLPLTFEDESLGVCLLEVGLALGIRDMLRAQISAALKNVVLHHEIVRKTALHERSVQERIATSKRMSSLSVLAGGVAHDLNNTLGPLVALPDVILQELAALPPGGPRAELEADVLTIKAAALRASQTIKDLLALGRQGRTQREALDLNEVVQSSCRGGEQSHPRGVRVRVHVATEPLVIRASETQLSRAVSNLLRNALEALEGGPGEVRIETSRKLLSAPLAAYETIEQGEYAVLTVHDSGCGIATADLGRIFEPFFSKKRTSESSGSGLGLSIVHGVVKEHEGFVHVESEEGKGTTFALYFPLAVGVVSEPERPRPALAAAESARILVIDDDPVQLRTAQRVLTRFGYRVATTRSGVEALELFAHAGRESPFDLVIVDVLLNERADGLSVLEDIRRRCPQQKGMLASGHAPPESMALAAERGLSWLAKPYTADALARAVQSSLHPH